MQACWQGKQDSWIDASALAANIFAEATNRTNIHNKTDIMHH